MPTTAGGLVDGSSRAVQHRNIVSVHMSDDHDLFEREHAQESAHRPQARGLLLVLCGLFLVIATVFATLAIDRSTTDLPESNPTETPGKGEELRPNTLPLKLGSQDVAVDSVSIPPGTSRASLIHFKVDVEPTPMSTPQAAMVSFRVECHSDTGAVEMQATGETTTNMFVAHGGTVSGQALTAATDQEITCSLMAGVPFAKPTDKGPTSLPLEPELHVAPATEVHRAALHRLDDATLFTPGTRKNVLSARVDDPSTLVSMSSTVRLTSCTVVGGSRDGGGENKCQESMTGRESSTVRMRVIARWLDDEGKIASTSTYWDETLAIDYNTHHTPWTLRLDGMAAKIPESAEGVVLVVEVESVAGTPLVVHAQGTDAVISTRS